LTWTEEKTSDEETDEKPEAVKEPSESADESETKADFEDAGRAQEPLPVSFSLFIINLANTAMLQLGFMQMPDQKEPKKDLVGARQTIDLLAVLEEKTAGNLTEEENRLLKETLFQLRMAYVEAAKQ
jgi:hypothetical protein